jgi:hypothetical protein
MSPTETPQPFYGTRLVFLNNNEGDTIIVSDTRISVRRLDEINEDQVPDGSVIVETRAKKYTYSDGSPDGGILFDRTFVEDIFKQVDSQTKSIRIKNITFELVKKKEKLMMETEELQRLEEELKWLKHEKEKVTPSPAPPEDVTEDLY